jgi:hypothetical protein
MQPQAVLHEPFRVISKRRENPSSTIEHGDAIADEPFSSRRSRRA